MCLIIEKANPETIVDDDLITSAHLNNENGFGIMAITDQNDIITEKILPESADDCIELYRKWANYPLAMHFRLTTVGETTLDMCHPFSILNKEEHGRDIWLMHNGPQLDVPIFDADKSDTWHMVEYILRPILVANPDLIESEDFIDLLQNLAGTERLLLVDAKNRTFVRVNSTSGIEVDDLWLSNTYSLKRNKGMDYNPQTGTVIPPTQSSYYKNFRQIWDWDDEYNTQYPVDSTKNYGYYHHYQNTQAATNGGLGSESTATSTESVLPAENTQDVVGTEIVPYPSQVDKDYCSDQDIFLPGNPVIWSDLTTLSSMEVYQVVSCNPDGVSDLINNLLEEE